MQDQRTASAGVLGSEDGEVLVVEIDLQPIHPELQRGLRVLQDRRKQPFPASNSQPSLVFGTDVEKLVGHPFLLGQMSSAVPLKWKALVPVFKEMVA